MTFMVGTGILTLLAGTGGFLDLTARRLPNWLCALTTSAGLAWLGFDQNAAAAGWAAVHALIALVAGMGLFGFGWIGGGDAKFYAACAAWFPLSAGLFLLTSVSLAGLLLVLGWFGYRRFTRRRQNRKIGDFAMVPYGLAVAVGAVAARAMLG